MGEINTVQERLQATQMYRCFLLLVGCSGSSLLLLPAPDHLLISTVQPSIHLQKLCAFRS